jgi:hypothetical protein
MNREETITKIAAEATRLFHEGYGSLEQCQKKAIKLWKEQEKIKEQVAYEKVFQEVE